VDLDQRLALDVAQAADVDEARVQKLRAGGEIIASGKRAASSGVLAAAS
jgi:hypothetical protein